MKHVVHGLFFGDSITYGEYDGVFGGWVDILKRYALQKFQESRNELLLFNLGIGGETTDGLVKRISNEIEARKSNDKNIVFIAYGANDLAIKKAQQLVSPEKFKGNLEEAVKKAQKYASDIFLANILPFSKEVDGVESKNGKLRKNNEVLVYNQIIEDVATDYSLGFIDFYSAIYEDKEQLLSKDGVHPNEKGYGSMAEIMIPLIDKFLNMNITDQSLY